MKPYRRRWYRDNKFDLVIQRGWYEKKDVKKIGVPMVWLPFSINPSEFKIPTPGRRNIIGFTGNTNSRIYKQRRKAVQILEKARLLDNKGKNLRKSKDYVRFLKSIKGGLSSSEIKSPYGKTFEIMASGAALLTPSFGGRENLFGDLKCMYEYKDNCSDLLKQARRITRNNGLRLEVIRNAMKIVKKKHNHGSRIKELNNHIKNMLEGKSIKHYWM
jgi:spore maturation protein CgeB